MGNQLHGVIVDAAAQMTVEFGWSAVTMAAVAKRVGVSRQTIYNEVGNRSDLAEALILSALHRYVELGETALSTHPDDIVEGIRMAAKDLLTLASDDKFIMSTLVVGHGTQTTMLPQLSTDAGSLLAATQRVVMARLETYQLPITQGELAVAVEALVRLGFSTAVQPSAAPEEAADRLAWVAQRLLM